ncbi:unnamed protein product, partial [Prorocentrum cordatum]
MLLALQETHASEYSMQVLLERLSKPFCCFSSCVPGGREDAGGVATVVPATADGYACDFVPEEVVPGRILRLSGEVRPSTQGSQPCNFVHWNIHNHDISPDQRRRVAERLRQDLAWARQCPATRSTFVVGDFSFGDCDEIDSFLDADQPLQAQATRPSRGGGGRAQAAAAAGQTARLARHPGQRQWLDALRAAAEMTPGKPTHWNASTRTSSSIDRVFVGTPRWQLCQGWQACQVRGEAREMHIRGISDHSMVAVSLLRRTPGRRRPDTPAAIPLAVEIVDGYLAMVPMQHQEPPDEYKYFARILQAAAKAGAAGVAQNAWARELVRASEQTRSVEILDYAEFQRRCNIAQRKDAAGRRRVLEEAAQHEPEESRRRQLVAQQRALKRRARLWAPFNARRYLARLETDGAELTEASDIVAALGQHWGKVFCPPTPAALTEQRAREQPAYLKRFWVPAVDWDAYCPPAAATVRE